MRVLIIEDDHDTRRLFTHALELAGHEVATAGNGAEGLSAALMKRPDIILLDLVMPVMNGWEFRSNSGTSRPSPTFRSSWCPASG